MKDREKKSVSLTKRQWTALEEEAHEKQIPVNELLRRIVDEHLEDRGITT